MAIDKTLAKKSQQHTVYKTHDGVRVPGVTTILGILAKPALIAWANKMGLQGIDTTKYVDAAADVGKACHAMIEAYLKNTEFDPLSYDRETIDLAENGFLKYLEWQNGVELREIESELQLVSEKHRFGGTIDLYCKLNGVPTLVDFKTNQSGIYDEMRHQVAGGYRLLLEESGRPVEQAMILRVGKTEAMDLETQYIGGMDIHADIFLTCLRLYELRRDLKLIRPPVARIQNEIL